MLASADERRAFIQGEWDARRFARSRNDFVPVAPADPRLATVYARGQAAWRSRAGPIPNSDKQQAANYVAGVWPVSCPNNGMGLQTISTKLGPAGTTAVVAQKVQVLKRTRQCVGFSGCGPWTQTLANTVDPESIDTANGGVCGYTSTNLNLGPLNLFMQVSKDGQELTYSLGSSSLSGFSSSTVTYAPLQPYSFTFSCESRPWNTARGTVGKTTPITFAGSIGNSCISLFSDILRYQNGNVVVEYQFAAYSTF